MIKLMSELAENIDKIHTTPLGRERICRNLGIENGEAVEWCKNAIEHAELTMRLGKNWYAYSKGVAITVNAKSYTIITAHKIHARVREMNESDYPCLNEFVYQAIFIPDGEPLPPRDIIFRPEISIYFENFGKQAGDLGVVAEQNGQVVGAAWTRIIAAYGHIDNETPELAIAILPEFRGCGIGTKLMKKLFAVLRENGYTQTSLSVQKNNPAVRFYEWLGYRTVENRPDETDHEDHLMIKRL